MSSLFRHGPQNRRTFEQSQFINSLKPRDREEMPGCTDLMEGFDIVFDEWLDDIFDQISGVVLSKLKTRFIIFGKELFNKLIDDTKLRFEVHQHMQATDWKIKIPLLTRRVQINIWGEIYATIVIGDHTHPLFEDLPILTLFLRPGTMYQFKLGEADTMPKLKEIYVEGSIYIIPYMLL